MTKGELHEILIANDFKLLEQDLKSAFYRKRYSNSKFRWYLKVFFDEDNVLTINGIHPEETLRKLDESYKRNSHE